ncbi:MAG: hypothetical protein HZA78_09315 [Candidatus Schekmanbacteria bacterium]|nr:hypothetical protein [Candidatus Schekmanbacteria bacterium]
MANKRFWLSIFFLINLLLCLSSWANEQSLSIPDSANKLPAKQNPSLTANPFWGYIRLAGTTFFGHNHHLNKAVIEDLLSARQSTYPVQSIIPYGSKLVQILKDRIIIEKNGVKKNIKITGSLDNPAQRKNLTTQGYQQVAQNEWLIKPNVMLKNNQKIEDILSEADIGLYYTDDLGIQGLKVNKFKPGSLFKELGVQEGDIIKGVNEEKIVDVKSALSAYKKLRNSPNVGLNIERAGNPLNLSYQMLSDGKPDYNIEKILQSPHVARFFNGKKTTGRTE